MLSRLLEPSNLKVWLGKDQKVALDNAASSFLPRVVHPSKLNGKVSLQFCGGVLLLVGPHKMQLLGLVATVFDLIGLGRLWHLNYHGLVGVGLVGPKRDLHCKLDHDTVADGPVPSVRVDLHQEGEGQK